MVNWQQNPVLFMAWFNTITLSDWMRGPLLTTVYRCVVSRSVYPMKGFKKTKASSFLAKDLFKGQVHGQIPPVRGCTCRQILLSEKVPSVMLLSPRPMHGYGKKGEWVWYPPMLKRDGLWQVCLSSTLTSGEEHGFQFLRTALLLLKCCSYW